MYFMFGKKDRILPALRSQPEPVLTAEHVDVRLQFARGNQLVIDPAETAAPGSVGGAGHDAPLPGRHDGHLGAARLITQKDDFGVLAQELQFVAEGGGGTSRLVGEQR